jgi:hypothetical protein
MHKQPQPRNNEWMKFSHIKHTQQPDNTLQMCEFRAIRGPCQIRVIRADTDCTDWLSQGSHFSHQNPRADCTDFASIASFTRFWKTENFWLCKNYYAPITRLIRASTLIILSITRPPVQITRPLCDTRSEADRRGYGTCDFRPTWPVSSLPSLLFLLSLLLGPTPSLS